MENACMVFVGAPNRAKRFQEAAREEGWRIHVAAAPEQAVSCCLASEPDLVIIDHFPESENARSVFYQLRMVEMGPFLVLNDSPGDLKFSGLNALSFMRMIARDFKANDLVKAVKDLLKTNGKSLRGRAAPSGPTESGRSRSIHPILREADAAGICCG